MPTYLFYINLSVAVADSISKCKVTLSILQSSLLALEIRFSFSVCCSIQHGLLVGQLSMKTRASAFRDHAKGKEHILVQFAELSYLCARR